MKNTNIITLVLENVSKHFKKFVLQQVATVLGDFPRCQHAGE